MSSESRFTSPDAPDPSRAPTDRSIDQGEATELEHLLDRYWFGHVTANERRTVEAWLDADPQRRGRYGQLRQTLLDSAHDTLSSAERTRRTAAIVQAIGQRPNVAASTATEQGAPRPISTRTDDAARRAPAWSRRAVRVAAAAVACVSVSAAVWLGVREAPRSAPMRARTYATRTGQRAVIVLEDGSRVQLAPRTTLRVTSGFGQATRTVSLVGQARFDVQHASGIPFIVQTGTTITRVLGTTFDVQQYPDEYAVRVAVTSGKVFVSGRTPQHPSVTLVAGMTGLITDSSAITVATSEAPYVGWTDGQLVFHRATTSDVLATLTRWYGYRFQLADSSLASQSLTVGLSTESSSAAFATLKQVLDVELRFEDSVVTLFPRRSGQTIPRAPRPTVSTIHPEVGR